MNCSTCVVTGPVEGVVASSSPPRPNTSSETATASRHTTPAAVPSTTRRVVASADPSGAGCSPAGAARPTVTVWPRSWSSSCPSPRSRTCGVSGGAAPGGGGAGDAASGAPSEGDSAAASPWRVAGGGGSAWRRRGRQWQRRHEQAELTLDPLQLLAELGRRLRTLAGSLAHGPGEQRRPAIGARPGGGLGAVPRS